MPTNRAFTLTFRCFCGARVKGKPGFTCRKRVKPGSNGRCHLHGGKSTGAKTPEGKARSIAAMVEGRRRWVADMKRFGLKLHCGRKPGADWVTPAMKARALRTELAASDPEALARLEKALGNPTSIHSVQLAEAKRALDALIRRLT